MMSNILLSDGERPAFLPAWDRVHSLRFQRGCDFPVSWWKWRKRRMRGGAMACSHHANSMQSPTSDLRSSQFSQKQHKSAWDRSVGTWPGGKRSAPCLQSSKACVSRSSWEREQKARPAEEPDWERRQSWRTVNKVCPKGRIIRQHHRLLQNLRIWGSGGLLELKQPSALILQLETEAWLAPQLYLVKS